MLTVYRSSFARAAATFVPVSVTMSATNRLESEDTESICQVADDCEQKEQRVQALTA